ncbi:hypothetical protein MRY87_11740 [bacterium]|nr:hypothetical protein [bacterium]
MSRPGVSVPSSPATHPFGGCDRTFRQYQILGEQLELLAQHLAENSVCRKWGIVPSRQKGEVSLQAFQDFQASVAFIPTEVLKSYREDLLDPHVSNSILSINASSSYRFARLFEKIFGKDRAGELVSLTGAIALVGLFGAFAFGLAAASSGAPFFHAFLFTLAIASPFVALWKLVPRDTTFKRLRFAQWVAHEIRRRRGDGGDSLGQSASDFLSPFWSEGGWTASSSAKEGIRRSAAVWYARRGGLGD